MLNDETAITVADGSEMHAYRVRPQSAPTKGLIVLQEAFGVNEYMRRMTERFAALGFLAIAPELFHRTAVPGFTADYEARVGVAENMGALTPEGQIADARACLDWLVAEGVPSERVAAIGFCMGGRAAYLANSALPLAASVSFYGGGIMAHLDGAASLSGPQLLVWGGADANIPAEQTRAIADALKAAERPFVEATFSEAGHGFACDARASYHAPSAREALALTDVFLAEHL